jgi:hypothetical protein
MAFVVAILAGLLYGGADQSRTAARRGNVA